MYAMRYLRSCISVISDADPEFDLSSMDDASIAQSLAKEEDTGDEYDRWCFNNLFPRPNVVYLRQKAELDFLKEQLGDCDLYNWIYKFVENDRIRREKLAAEPLIANPYKKGSYLRKSAYLSRFSVCSHSPDKDPSSDELDDFYEPDDYYAKLKSRRFNRTAPTITAAIKMVQSAVAKGLVHEQYITIIDNASKRMSYWVEPEHKILNGIVRGDKVEWVKPFTDEELLVAQRDASLMRAEAAEESRWDNFSSARNIRNDITRLMFGDVNKVWAQHPEVISVFK